MTFKRINVLLLITTVAALIACGKLQDKLMNINPQHVTQQFLETWKKKDWKALYQISDASFMQQLRTQKLSPELQRMSDQELFVHEFEQAQRLNPDKILISYTIDFIPLYKNGETTLWVYVHINGKRKMIPLTLDGLSLKVDLTRIK